MALTFYHDLAFIGMDYPDNLRRAEHLLQPIHLAKQKRVYQLFARCQLEIRWGDLIVAGHSATGDLCNGGIERNLICRRKSVKDKIFRIAYPALQHLIPAQSACPE